MKRIYIWLMAVSLLQAADHRVPFLFEHMEQVLVSYRYRPVTGSYDAEGEFSRFPARLFMHYHDLELAWMQRVGPVSALLQGTLAGLSVPSDILNRVDFGGGDMAAGLVWRPREDMWTAGITTIPTGSFRLGLGEGVWRFRFISGARFKKKWTVETAGAFAGADPDGRTPGAELGVRARYQGMVQPVLGFLWQAPDHSGTSGFGDSASWKVRLEIMETVSLRRNLHLFTHGYADIAGHDTERAIGIGLGLFR